MKRRVVALCTLAVGLSLAQPGFASPADDPGAASVSLTKTGAWVTGLTLATEQEVFCHVYGEGVFRVQFRCGEKSARRTVELPARDWALFSRVIGPGAVEVLVEPVAKSEYPTPVFGACVVTTRAEYTPSIVDFEKPLYCRITNTGGQPLKLFGSGMCQNPANYYLQPGYVASNGFAAAAALPPGAQTTLINLSRLIFGRTVLGLAARDAAGPVSYEVAFFRDRAGTKVAGHYSLRNDAAFTANFIFYPEPDGVRVATAAEVIAAARQAIDPADLKRKTPSQLWIAAPVADVGEKLAEYRNELLFCRELGINAAAPDLGRLEGERQRYGLLYNWTANFIPLWNDCDWPASASKAQQYVRDQARVPTGGRPTVIMLADEPAFSALAKGPALQQRFLAWASEQRLTAAELGVADVAAVDLRSPSLSLNKRLFTWLWKFQAEEQIQYWSGFARLFKQANPDLVAAVNWQADLSYSGVNYLDLWAIYRPPGLEIAWAEDWYGWMPNCGVIAWYADLMRSQTKYRKIPQGTYPIVYSYAPCAVVMDYYERLSRGCTAFHPYSYSLRGNDTPWIETPALVKTVARVHREIAEVEDIVARGVVQPATVALLYPNSCALWDPQAFLDILALYLGLLHSGIPADILSEQDLLDGAGRDYRVLYVAGANFRDGLLPAIEKFARDGGVVCCSSPSLRNEFDEPLTGQDGVFGAARIELLSNASSGRFAYEFKGSTPIDTVDWAGRKIAVFCQKSRVVPAPGAEVLATFADGSPALCRSRLGKGAVYLYGFEPGLSYLHADYTNCAGGGLLTSLAAQDAEREFAVLPVTGIAQPVSVSRSLIGVRVIESADGILAGLVDYGIGQLGRTQKNPDPWTVDSAAMEPYPVTVTVNCAARPVSVTGVRTRKLAWRYETGAVVVEVPLRLVELIVIRTR